MIYNHPYCVPIKFREIQQIHIYIKDDKGQDASFIKGKVTITLHFKKVSFRIVNMNSQTYVSDPTIWSLFYQNMSKNKFNPYKNRKQKKNQTGRGMYGRFRGSYMIPVNSNTTSENSQTNTPLVTPVSAAEERTVS